MSDEKQYQRVFFRIESGYVWGSGMPEEKDDVFRQSVKEFLTKHGFEVDEPTDKHYCITGKRGFEDLYCHPQNISGNVDKTKIDELEDDLKNGDYAGFTFRYTDRFEDVKNMTDEEIDLELQNSKEDIKNAILELFKTKRSNLYKTGAIATLYSHADSLLKEMKANRDDVKIKFSAEKFVRDIFDEMIADGDIIEADTKNGKGYRTDNNKKYF